jgi:hypothetical protein
LIFKNNKQNLKWFGVIKIKLLRDLSLSDNSDLINRKGLWQAQADAKLFRKGSKEFSEL